MTFLLLLLATATNPLPADVRRFVADHESCEHWLGEDGYDAARAREIAAAVRASCTGIDARRARLLHRYRRASSILRQVTAHAPLER